jgi:hypothetical protein
MKPSTTHQRPPGSTAAVVMVAPVGCDAKPYAFTTPGAAECFERAMREAPRLPYVTKVMRVEGLSIEAESLCG